MDLFISIGWMLNSDRASILEYDLFYREPTITTQTEPI